MNFTEQKRTYTYLQGCFFSGLLICPSPSSATLFPIMFQNVRLFLILFFLCTVMLYVACMYVCVSGHMQIGNNPCLAPCQRWGSLLSTTVYTRLAVTWASHHASGPLGLQVCAAARLLHGFRGYPLPSSLSQASHPLTQSQRSKQTSPVPTLH